MLWLKEGYTMTVQLSTRVDPKVKQILSELHRKTHVPIRVLTEKAVFLL
ncbi:MAG: ribbon-helix-helix domain-containing protein, partial [Candidatus Omnitrophica bacterium]|nr:ribbon-helix-helix domain-containing protein [Candidatus Omnitrophota bacterium]